MASLFIKDSETADLVTRVARRLGLTKTDAVHRAVAQLEASLDRSELNPDAPEWLKTFWRDHPLPSPTGLKADKAFFDDLSGDL
jgi:antitoxin VapB